MCDECAQKVMKILKEMSDAGEFDSEIDKQIMGMRLRQEIECPAREQV